MDWVERVFRLLISFDVVILVFHFCQSQKAVVQIRGDGMKVTVEEGRSIQG